MTVEELSNQFLESEDGETITHSEEGIIGESPPFEEELDRTNKTKNSNSLSHYTTLSTKRVLGRYEPRRILRSQEKRLVECLVSHLDDQNGMRND